MYFNGYLLFPYLLEHEPGQLLKGSTGPAQPLEQKFSLLFCVKSTPHGQKVSLRLDSSNDNMIITNNKPTTKYIFFIVYILLQGLIFNSIH